MTSGDRIFHQAAKFFHLLSHPARLRILQALHGKETSVKQLFQLAGVSKSHLSQHLALLRHAGLIRSGRRNGSKTYMLDDFKARHLCRQLKRYLQ